MNKLVPKGWGEKSMENRKSCSRSKAYHLILGFGCVKLLMELVVNVCIDQMTADKSSRMNSEVYRAVLSAQIL